MSRRYPVAKVSNRRLPVAETEARWKKYYVIFRVLGYKDITVSGTLHKRNYCPFLHRDAKRLGGDLGDIIELSGPVTRLMRRCRCRRRTS